MNIFILDRDPETSARYHVDTHVVKMPLETAQMLCTVVSIWCETDKISVPVQIPYKPTHKNHPCTIWAAESYANFRELIKIGRALCKEYTHRYNKVHACEKVIDDIAHIAEWCVEGDFKLQTRFTVTPFAQAMPDEFKNNNPVKAYRNYYKGAKSHLFKWTKRRQPFFINN